MLDKSADTKQASKVEKINKPDPLQKQLDDFVETENAASDAVEHAEYGADSQHRLDAFVDDLQKQMDAFVKPGSQPKMKQVTAVEKESDNQQAVAAKPAPARINITNPQKTVFEQKSAATGSGSLAANIVHLGKLNARVLASAGLLIAVVVWISWPNSTVEPPVQLMTENNMSAESLPEVLERPTAKVIEPAEPMEESMLTITPEPSGINMARNERREAPVNMIATVKQRPVVDEPAAAPVTLSPVSEQAPIKPAATVHNSVLSVASIIGNIRREPNTSAEVLHRLKQGTRVFAIKREGDWVQVRINGRLAWGHHTVFAMNAESSGKELDKLQTDAIKPVPAIKSTGSTEGVINKILTVTSMLGNVRSNAEIGAPVLFRLKQGTKVFALKREGDWVQVRIKDAVAWAHHSIF